MLIPDLHDGDPCEILINGKSLGPARIRHIFSDRTGSPDSYAIVCPLCGDAWGHIHSSPFTGYTPVSHLCAACGDGQFKNLIFHYNDFSLPIPAMCREFQLEERWGEGLPQGSSYA